MPDIVVTLPAKIEWADYRRELDAVADWSAVMRFKVPHLPRVARGDKCFLVWRGFVRGWMTVVGCHEGEFVCETTGRKWIGRFVERSGPFQAIEPVPMKGFQGFRYYGVTA